MGDTPRQVSNLATRRPALGTGRWTLAAVGALILFAILVTALRLALPLANGYRDLVSEVLSERLGYRVDLGAMSLRLAGLTPRLTLDDVSLLDPETGVKKLGLRALELDLAPLDSLRLGSPQWRALTLVGARLSVQRLEDGRIQVMGLGALLTDDRRSLELFLSQGRLSLVESEVILLGDRPVRPLLRLTDLSLSLENAGHEHRLALSARPESAAQSAGGSAPALLRVQAHLAGDAADLSGWGGDLYASLEGQDLPNLLPAALLPAAFSVASSAGVTDRLETWVRLQDGALVEALGRIRTRGLVLRLPTGAGAAGADRALGGPGAAVPASAESADRDRVDPAHLASGLTLDRLAGLVRLRPAGTGWQLEVADLGLAVAGADLDGIGLDLGLTRAGRLERLELAAAVLDLAAAARLARWAGRAAPGPLPAGLDRLLGLEPSGRLQDLGVRLAIDPGVPPRWQARAYGQGLGLARNGRIPGVAGLSLALSADGQGGALRLGSEGLTLDLSPIFDRPIVLEQLSGLLAWRRGADGTLRLVGRNLAVENPDLRGRARFALDLPAPRSGLGPDPDRSPFLDMRASFTDGNGANVRPYLPVGIMHKDLVAWLTRALVTSRVTQADLLLRGPLGLYPFRRQEGVFELVLDFEDAVLDYLAGWPRIRESTGTLRFHNQGLEIRVESGRLLDSEVKEATATIPDLWGARRMAIRGVAEGPMSDGLRILAETPLSRRLGPIARALDVQGRSRLELSIGLPLARGEPLGVDGRVTWPGPAGVALVGTPIALDQLAGELRFSLDSIRAQSIRGRLWGQPLDLGIATRNAGDPRTAATQVRARTRLPVKELAARLPSPAWRLASGSLDLELGVDLRNANLEDASLPLVLNLSSDLRGLALDLPAPLGKRANQAGRLDLSADLVPGQSLGLVGGLGVLALNLDLVLDQRGPRLDRGRVRLGGEPAAKPDALGLAVDGTLETLDLPAWSDWWGRVQKDMKDLGPTAAVGVSGLRSLDLRVGRLDLGGPVLGQARIQAAPLDLSAEARQNGGGRAGGWVLRAESRELAGRLTLPPPGRGLPLDLALLRLDLKALTSTAPGGSAEPGSAKSAARRVRRIPALDLRVDDLRWGEGSLGRLSLSAAPDELGTRISGIDFRGNGDTAIAGDAAWIDGEDGGRGRVALKLSSADPGPLLRVLDSANAVSQAPLEGSLSLQWPGGLQDFALADATGLVELELGAGRLPKLEPGVGRVLGFLNLSALTRRLSLDFRDLYQEGFSFERIAGRIRLGDGRATVQTFDIEGPASRIAVSGYSDLRKRTFDQTVTVEPSIGTSVAIAGAVAGGPAVGAAVFVLNRLSGGAIDRFGSFQYRVTGPWSDPVLQPIGWEPFAQGQTVEGPPAGLRGERADAAGGSPKVPAAPSRKQPDNLFLD